MTVIFIVVYVVSKRITLLGEKMDYPQHSISVLVAELNLGIKMHHWWESEDIEKNGFKKVHYGLIL